MGEATAATVFRFCFAYIGTGNGADAGTTIPAPPPPLPSPTTVMIVQFRVACTCPAALRPGSFSGETACRETPADRLQPMTTRPCSSAAASSLPRPFPPPGAGVRGKQATMPAAASPSISEPAYIHA